MTLKQQLDDRGYVIVPGVVPGDLVAAAVDAVLDEARADLNDPSTWYENEGWNIPIYQHEALWNVRQYPAVYEVFVELTGTEKLWVTMDSACFKPPLRAVDESDEFVDFIHFDRHPFDDVEILQGVVCLNDTSPEMGGFQCAPDSVRNPTDWLARDDFNPESFSFSNHSAMEIERPATSAGDLIVFTSKLAHGNGRNVSNTPRLAQYVTMMPAGDDEEAVVRTEAFEARLPPPFFRKKRADPEAGSPAQLTSLGRKLLGAEPW